MEYQITMEYKEIKKSISTLSDRELSYLIKDGHIGVQTKSISELWSFYCAVEEEIKRRELKRKELQKVLPIDKYFRVITNEGSYLFKVVECCNAPEGMHITHYCRIEGFEIVDNTLKPIKTLSSEDFQISDSLEFGWNAYRQEMIFWQKGSIAPYETIETSKESYDSILRTFEIVGFDV